MKRVNVVRRIMGRLKYSTLDVLQRIVDWIVRVYVGHPIESCKLEFEETEEDVRAYRTVKRFLDDMR